MALFRVVVVSVPYRGCSFFNAVQKHQRKQQKVTFPSLTGVVRFLIIDNRLRTENKILLFPSLTGVVRFLINFTLALRAIDEIIVSVPYRGCSFFNVNMDFKRFKNIKFPSLTGVVRFLMLLNRFVYLDSEIRFPSLTGVVRFLIEKTTNAKTNTVNKFPSLTGVVRFLIYISLICNVPFPKVSVPYRGCSFFNPTLQNPHGYWAQNAFCGAKLFLIGNR